MEREAEREAEESQKVKQREREREEEKSGESGGEIGVFWRKSAEIGGERDRERGGGKSERGRDRQRERERDRERKIKSICADSREDSENLRRVEVWMSLRRVLEERGRSFRRVLGESRFY